MNITFILLILLVVTMIYLLQNLLNVAKDRKSKYNWYLKIVVSLIFLEAVCGLLSIQFNYPHIYLLTFPLKFAILPLLIIIGLIYERYKKKNNALKYFCIAIPVISFIVLVPFYILDSSEKLLVIKNQGLIQRLQLLLLPISNLIVFYGFKRQVAFIYNKKSKISVLITIAIVLSFLLMLSTMFWSDAIYTLDLILSLFLFGIILSLKRVKPKSQKNIDLLTDLNKSMVEERLFLDPNLSLKQLSDFLNISPNEVSRVINSELSIGFKDYINSFRVKEVIKIMKDINSVKYTLDYISKSAGFNSSTTFNKAFKKVTGKTPKQYRKLTDS